MGNKVKQVTKEGDISHVSIHAPVRGATKLLWPN